MLTGTGEEGYEYFTLDDEIVRTPAELDPMGFCLHLPPKAIIDETQRASRLFTAIKYIIDQKRTPGRLILAGAGRVGGHEREDELLIKRLYVGHLSELTSRIYEHLGAGLSELIVRWNFPATLTRPHELSLLLRHYKSIYKTSKE